ncbi:hypothetical protein LCGC14_2977310, partial [marine sediment metagenome]
MAANDLNNQSQKMSDLGGFLRNARGRRSIEVMAAEMGVNKNTLGGYERGERLPDVDFLAAFSLRTGESFARLLWARLKDVDDPEEKRRVIGHTFIKVFENKTIELEKEFPNIKFLAQGTIYP